MIIRSSLLRNAGCNLQSSFHISLKNPQVVTYISCI